MPNPASNENHNRGNANPNKLWEPGAIRIAWLYGAETALARQVIELAEQWLPHLNGKVGFAWNCKPATAHVRISFMLGSGCWSYIGTDALAVPVNKPTMNLDIMPRSTPQNTARIVLHEFGHMLGLLHEHQHPTANIPWDKAACYAYYRGEHNWTREMVDANIFGAHKDAIATEFDPLSIMLYPIPGELLTDKTRAIPWLNDQISNKDAIFVQNLYN